MPYSDVLLSHEVLLYPIPPPQLQVFQEPARHSPRRQAKAVLRFVFSDRTRELRSDLSRVSMLLRELYYSNIPPSALPSVSSYPKDKTVPWVDYFCDVVIDPVVNLFSNLRARAGWSPIMYKKSSRTSGCSLITFYPPRMDFKVIPRDGERKQPPPNFPAVVLVPSSTMRGTIASDPECIRILTELLEPVWKNNARTWALCCDLENIVTLEPRGGTQARELICGHIPIPSLVATKVILAAYLVNPLFAMEYLLELESGESQGGVGPLLPLTSITVFPDKAVFSRYLRHSDFDHPLLFNSKAHEEQFYRWQYHMVTVVKSHTTCAGDVLRGITNKFARTNPLLRPYYPAIRPPKPTMQYFGRYRRPDPMRDYSSQFQQSSSFNIRIIRELTDKRSDTRPRPCRTYVCQLVSLDNRRLPIRTPLLCLKLFDDRFFVIENMWSLHTTEDLIRNEIAVYQKLDFMQGSLLPYFYGAHLFDMPSEPSLYGILMEYIEAPSISVDSLQSLSKAQQLQLIQSARHGVRVLQYADISQHDWHESQILIHRNRYRRGGDPHVHCVFIDFAACTQSTFAAEDHLSDDFGSCISTLVDTEVLSHDLVARVFGRREVWDRQHSGPQYKELEDLYNKPEAPLLAMFGLS